MTQKRRFEALDGLRGVCALLVVLYHSDTVLHTGHLLNHAFLCVDVFFVLSGFVIGYNYEGRLNAGFSFPAFVRARARRLVPVHWTATAIVSAVALATFWYARHVNAAGIPSYLTPSSLLVAAALGFLLVPDFWMNLDLAFPLNGPLWSLMDEWIINLAYARWLFRLKTWGLCLLWAILWGALAYLTFRSPYGIGFGDHISNLGPGIVRAAAGFIAGLLINRLSARIAFERLPKLKAELVYALCFAITAVPTVQPLPLFDLCAVAAMPLFVVLLLNAERPHRVFVWLGDISYPLYVVHYAPIIVALALLWYVPGRHSSLFAIPILCAAVALAWIVARSQAARPRDTPALQVPETV